MIIIIQTYYLEAERIPYLFPKRAAAFIKNLQNPGLETKSYKSDKKSIAKVTFMPIL